MLKFDLLQAYLTLNILFISLVLSSDPTNHTFFMNQPYRPSTSTWSYQITILLQTNSADSRPQILQDLRLGKLFLMLRVDFISFKYHSF